MYLLLIGLLHVAWAVFYFRFLKDEFDKARRAHSGLSALESKFLPFARLDFQRWSFAKFWVQGSLLIPFKAVMFLSVALIYLGIVLFLTAVFNQKHREQLKEKLVPLVGWAQRLFRVIYRVRTVPLEISDFREGFVKTHKNPSIYISNHVSWIDTIFYIIKHIHHISFLAKIQVDSVPLINIFARQHHSLFINRDSKDQRNGTLQLIRQRAQRVQLGQDLPLMIYPQGTTSNGRYLLPFKQGAFESMHPIKIFCIQYTNKQFSPALDSVGGVTALLVSLAQTDNCGICYQLDTIDPQANHIKTPQEYSKFCRELVGDVLRVELSKSGFRDKSDYYNSLRGKTV